MKSAQCASNVYAQSKNRSCPTIAIFARWRSLSRGIGAGSLALTLLVAFFAGAVQTGFAKGSGGNSNSSQSNTQNSNSTGTGNSSSTQTQQSSVQGGGSATAESEVIMYRSIAAAADDVATQLYTSDPAATRYLFYDARTDSDILAERSIKNPLDELYRAIILPLSYSTLDQQGGTWQLQWTPVSVPAGSAVTYKIYRGRSQGAEDQQHPIASTSNVYEDTNAESTPATAYFYYVVPVVNGVSESESNEIEITTPVTLSGAAEADTNGHPIIKLTWTGPLLGRYNVYRASGGNNSSPTLIAQPLISNYTDTQVQAGQTYYYFVTFQTDQGESLPSNIKTIKASVGHGGEQILLAPFLGFISPWLIAQIPSMPNILGTLTSVSGITNLFSPSTSESGITGPTDADAFMETEICSDFQQTGHPLVTFYAPSIYPLGLPEVTAAVDPVKTNWADLSTVDPLSELYFLQGKAAQLVDSDQETILLAYRQLNLTGLAKAQAGGPLPTAYTKLTNDLQAAIAWSPQIFVTTQSSQGTPGQSTTQALLPLRAARADIQALIPLVSGGDGLSLEALDDALIHIPLDEHIEVLSALTGVASTLSTAISPYGTVTSANPAAQAPDSISNMITRGWQIERLSREPGTRLVRLHLEMSQGTDKSTSFLWNYWADSSAMAQITYMTFASDGQIDDAGAALAYHGFENDKNIMTGQGPKLLRVNYQLVAPVGYNAAAAGMDLRSAEKQPLTAVATAVSGAQGQTITIADTGDGSPAFIVYSVSMGGLVRYDDTELQQNGKAIYTWPDLSGVELVKPGIYQLVVRGLVNTGDDPQSYLRATMDFNGSASPPAPAPPPSVPPPADNSILSPAP